jgi:hypothetical protein
MLFPGSKSLAPNRVSTNVTENCLISQFDISSTWSNYFRYARAHTHTPFRCDVWNTQGCRPNMRVSCAEHKQDCRPHIFSVRATSFLKIPPGVSALTYGTTSYYTATGCLFYRVRRTRQLLCIPLRMQALYAVKLR